ncbi:unnamed protein product [Didymodactylos carnosus]|uniref:Oligopeptide transporter n=1 Tax=Didymodactylos carnosus TaxID=1234261 RepID=A0A815A224_9BILA|nr:unnamed protein product [Didymodactylos carnosus]CAF4021161.1 unnamed protein product [Didymodactylos carnosus]
MTTENISHIFKIDNRRQFENTDRSEQFIYTNELLQDTQTKFSAVEQSPFEEVAAIVPNTDDETMECSTFRSWTIGLLFTIIISIVNQFFFFRLNPLTIGSIIVQVLSLPLGKIMARFLPAKYIRIWKWQFSLNPGPFNTKEHTLITVMANTAYVGQYAMNVIVVYRIHYRQTMNHAIAIFFLISSQVIGYGLAGMMRRFLVWPAPMIWPSVLVTCAFFRSLHESKSEDQLNNISKWKMSRRKFFLIMTLCSFTYYWLPGYIFPLLSAFSFLCMVKPQSNVFSQITGTYGLGIGTVQLDWNSITAYLGSPLVIPASYHVNVFIGFVIMAWIIIPIVYYTNVWDGKRYPLASSNLYTTEGYIYDVNSVLDKHSYLNETAYIKRGPVRLGIVFAITYGASFAALPAAIVHVVLCYGKDIWRQLTMSITEAMNEIHAKLMAKYPEVPEWWYTILFIVNFFLACIVCHFGDLMPWYWMFLCVSMAFVLLLPVGIILATSNQQIGLNIVTEFIAGFAMAGYPIQNVTFKTYGYITQSQALLYLQDLKLGHYMKIPPRRMLFAQVIATIISSVVSYIVANYLIIHIKNICTELDVQWSCPNIEIFYSASVLWGAVGPTRMFVKNDVSYYNLLWFFPLGAVLPAIPWLLIKRFPKQTWLRLIHTPIIWSALSVFVPAPAGNYCTWFFVGILFNFIVRKYDHDWWERYVFVLSSALDCGVAFSALVIFIALQNQNINFPIWWGSGGNYGDGCPLSHANYSGVIPHYPSS